MIQPKWAMEFVLLGILIASISPLTSAKVNQPLVVMGGMLIDGTGAEPIKSGVVVISDDRIARVGSKTNVTIPKGSKVIDCEGGTILPGFINAHVHGAYDEIQLQAWAREGVTTVRDLAGQSSSDYYSKVELLNKNPLNARLVAASPPMSGSLNPKRYDFQTIIITNEDEARKGVTRALDHGADIIKILLESNWNLEVFSETTLKVLIETAHKRGTRVSAYIGLTQGIQRAINSGVDDIANIVVDPLTDEIIAKMVDAGIYVCPTLEMYKSLGFDTYSVDNLSRFAKAGGKIALGTNYHQKDKFYEYEGGMPLKEILWMQEAGMSPSQIIVAATKNAAVVCDMGSELGTLEPGKIADILVVDGNPLQDLASLKKALLVIKGGEIIRQ